MSSEHASLHRQPFLTPLWLSGVAVVLLAAFVVWLAFATWLWTTAHSTTVIVIRHAEERTAGETPAADVPLTPAGEARAQSLARLFGSMGPTGQGRGAWHGGRLDAIYTTASRRSRDTAAPLARSLGLTPVVDGGNGPAELAYRVLHEHPGGRALLVSDAAALPALVRELSGEAVVPPLEPAEYDTMYVITVPRIGTANYLKVRY